MWHDQRRDSTTKGANIARTKTIQLYYEGGLHGGAYGWDVIKGLEERFSDFRFIMEFSGADAELQAIRYCRENGLRLQPGLKESAYQ